MKKYILILLVVATHIPHKILGGFWGALENDVEDIGDAIGRSAKTAADAVATGAEDAWSGIKSVANDISQTAGWKDAKKIGDDAVLGAHDVVDNPTTKTIIEALPAVMALYQKSPQTTSATKAAHAAPSTHTAPTKRRR